MIFFGQNSGPASVAADGTVGPTLLGSNDWDAAQRFHHNHLMIQQIEETGDFGKIANSRRAQSIRR